MKAWTLQRVSIVLIIAVASATGLAVMDWNYFFPLSAHSDLRFQAIGETLEVIFLGMCFWVMFRIFEPERRSGGQLRVAAGKRVLTGILIGAYGLAEIGDTSSQKIASNSARQVWNKLAARLSSLSSYTSLGFQAARTASRIKQKKSQSFKAKPVHRGLVEDKSTLGITDH